MNEQIQKLWEQSAQRDDIWNQARHEKFAELIVKECCQKLEDDGMVEIAIEMKQHFGVES